MKHAQPVGMIHSTAWLVVELNCPCPLQLPSSFQRKFTFGELPSLALTSARKTQIGFSPFMMEQLSLCERLMLRLGSSALIGTTRSSRRIVAKALRQAFSNPLTDDNSVGIDP